MKLKVLAGAKSGAEIPLKKHKFVIGRASDCTLRAGSDAISRRHCVLLRTEQGVTVQDLGSRNGTFVNGANIEGETPLRHGDELKVGPLEFVFDHPADLDRQKRPKVEGVADSLQRTAEKGDSVSVEDDDISRWLLGPEPQSEAAMRETQSFRMDETHAVMDGKATILEDPAAGDDDAADEGEQAAEGAEEGDEEKGGKKKPGKLPPLPAKPQAKDSCEAAADVLRELARRR
ncbi:MAG: FHA domain-containing protein [Planctomycetota bacterium]